MRKRWEPLSPGVVIGLWAALLAWDMRALGNNLLLHWLIGFWAPFLGCLWVGRKHRSQGRGVGRSAWITVTMGAIAGTCVFPVIGTIFGAVLTAVFILPPTLWIAALSVAGFRRSREGSFARTIWWRRRWHATLAVCIGAIGVRLMLVPSSAYAVFLSAATAAIAALCLVSLGSMARELASVTRDVTAIASPAPLGYLDLGVGEATWGVAAVSGAGPYRLATVTTPRLVGDLGHVRAMMRHSLWGAIALTTFAVGTLTAALVGYLSIS